MSTQLRFVCTRRVGWVGEVLSTRGWACPDEGPPPRTWKTMRAAARALRRVAIPARNVRYFVQIMDAEDNWKNELIAGDLKPETIL